MKIIPGLLLAAACATSAHAQEPIPRCMPPADMAEALDRRFGESLQAQALLQGGRALLQVYASPGGSVTVVIRGAAEANACITWGGRHWELVEGNRGEKS